VTGLLFVYRRRSADQARLNMSQPPLSRQIGALEEDLGAVLFERTPKGMLLTPAGRQFLAEARNILLLIEQARRNTSAAGRGDMGELTVGFTMCAAYSVVPILTRLYMAALPKVTLRMRELMPNALERDLKEGVIDLAITFPGSEAPDLQTQALLREPLNVVLPHEQNMKLAEEVANEIAIMGIRLGFERDRVVLEGPRALCILRISLQIL
jgi:DNA-binding transcriptional LysR family regulator